MAAQVSAFQGSASIKQGFVANTRLLGTLGMIFSSGMFLDLIADQAGSDLVNRLGATAGLLFTVGWFSNVLGLRALEATGKRLPGKILLGVELFGVSLAALFQVFSIVTPNAEHLLFTITDIAWLLSMLTLMIIGIVVAIRGGLRGPARFIPHGDDARRRRFGAGGAARRGARLRPQMVEPGRVVARDPGGGGWRCSLRPGARPPDHRLFQRPAPDHPLAAIPRTDRPRARGADTDRATQE